MTELVLSPFPTTVWSVVVRAGARDSVLRKTLHALLDRYTPALRSYLLVQHRVSPDRADDLLQGFLADKVLEQELISQADQTRGRFRSFLMCALNNYVVSQIRHDRAAKRSPASGASIGDQELLTHPAPASADLFDVAWGRQVLNLALERMQSECETSARPELWGIFEARVLRPTLQQAEPLPLTDLTARFHITAEQASNLLTTAKRMYARNLRHVVGEYADGEADAEEEIRCLKAVLARA